MSPNLLMSTSDPEPDEQSVNLEHGNEAADPANKYTGEKDAWQIKIIHNWLQILIVLLQYIVVNIWIGSKPLIKVLKLLNIT